MLLALALEYVDAFNDGETVPTISTALERVRMNHAMKLNDQVFDEFKENLEKGMAQENLEMPLTEHLMAKVARRAIKKARSEFMSQLGTFLSYEEVLEEYAKLSLRLNEHIETKKMENYSHSYHFTC